MHRLKKILTSRVIGVAICICAEIGLLSLLVYSASTYYEIYPYIQVASFLLVIYIINRQEDPSYKIAWCVVILAVPVFGGPLFLLCAGKKMPKKLAHGTTMASNRMKNLLTQDTNVLSQIEEIQPELSPIFLYGLKGSSFPVYNHTKSTYFPNGETFLPVFLEELKKAKHFIFLEFFIIDEGEMWESVLEILKEKVNQGVQVKLIYDDFGCAITLPDHYDRKLNAMGIETYRFNHLRPALIIQMNNRDHRKICVIDNQVGFTGGLNLADEYCNKIKRFGYWKDSGIMIQGDAVWSLTVMFLGMYSYLKGEDSVPDYSIYRLPCPEEKGDGFYQPYSDTPTDLEDMGLSMHLNMINHAKKYLYIDTPYLILNSAVQTALIVAKKNGVDVRILTPHIPDKWFVFQVTQSNYKALLEAGIRIYEYTPGFNHAKNFVSDDRLAIVGTVNTDYRSYYLHFEDGILLYNTPTVLDIRKDFETSIQKSHEITLEEYGKTNVLLRMLRGVLNLFAPLV